MREMSQNNKGRPPQQAAVSNIKVADYFKKWLVAIKSEVRPNTYRSYKGNMENHIIPCFEKLGTELQELKPHQLSDYYKSKV